MIPLVDDYFVLFVRHHEIADQVTIVMSYAVILTRKKISKIKEIYTECKKIFFHLLLRIPKVYKNIAVYEITFIYRLSFKKIIYKWNLFYLNIIPLLNKHFHSPRYNDKASTSSQLAHHLLVYVERTVVNDGLLRDCRS